MLFHSEGPKKNSSHEEDRYLAVAGHTWPKDHRLHAPCIKKMTLTSCEEVICRKYCSLCSVCCTSWLRKLFCTGVNPLVVHLLCLDLKGINSLMHPSLYWAGRTNVPSARSLQNSCARLAFTALGADSYQQRAKQNILGKQFNCLNR